MKAIIVGKNIAEAISYEGESFKDATTRQNISPRRGGTFSRYREDDQQSGVSSRAAPPVAAEDGR